MPGPSKTRPYAEHGCSVSTFQLARSPKPDKTYRARRAHRKSKNGCIHCKARKVKCDEARPNCDRCQTYGSPCTYTSSTPKHPRTAVALARRPTPIHESASLAWGAVQSDVHTAAWSGLCSSETEQSVERVARVELEVLAHFAHMVSLEDPFYPHLKKVFRDYAIPAALNEPCLLYAILAVSSTHHAQVRPETAQQSMVSATQFRYTAVQLYRKRLSRPIHKSDMDVLLSTCLLVSSFSFALDRHDEDKPSLSWVFNNDPSALNWLSVQGGLWSLIRVVNPWLDDSVWRPAFAVSSAYQTTEKQQTGRASLHVGLADLCDIDDTTTEETNALYWPLRMLSPMLVTPVSRSRDHVSRATDFMGRLLPEYLALLQAREPRALLLLAYWLAVLGSVKEWWVERRARAECRAICMFLEQCGDEKVAGLLAFPAVMCGYW